VQILIPAARLVNDGILELNMVGTRPGAFYVKNGASLNVNSPGACVVGALYTNDVALPNGMYTSVNLPGFITGTNALQVVNVTIGFSLNGDNLRLSWPTNYLGWVLQEQVSNLDIGAKWELGERCWLGRA
jgi:hypothetical protein